MIHTCWCHCGNISVTGRVLSSNEVPKKLQTGRAIVGSAKCSTFAIKPQAIEVKDIDQANFIQEDTDGCIVTCRACGQSIRYIDSVRCGYAMFNKDTKKTRRQSAPIECEELTQNVKKFIKIPEPEFFYDPVFTAGSAPIDDIPDCQDDDEEEIDLDDDEEDFEYMFSRKSEPFIGSFKDRFIYNTSMPILI